jgi:hypothetical protein
VEPVDQDLGLPIFSIDDAAPEAVATKMPPFSSRWRAWDLPPGWRRSDTPWDVRRVRLDRECGEIRRGEDWLKLPEGKWVLILALLIDVEYVIRWATERALKATQDLPMHDKLLGPGDYWSDLRRGWAELTQDGRVVVR